jgi:hypothetical protein
VEVVSDLVDPESLNIVAKLIQPLISDLVTPAELASPVPMIALPVYLDRKPAIPGDHEEVQNILLHRILRYRMNA